MTAAVAGIAMALAARCLGARRRDWGLAMQAEFEEAVRDGRPLLFAIGCLLAAGREMARQVEGRLVLSSHALALGLVLPIAALQFERAIGIALLAGRPLPEALAAGGVAPNPYLIWSQNTATPVLLVLWLLLGIAHLGLAWALAEHDWPRVVRSGAAIGAATTTLSLFTGVLMLDLSPLVAHAAALGVELAAILAAARWHARSSPDLLA